MTSHCELFLVALAERLNRLWGKALGLDVRFCPCQPLERYAVEVMVGLPAATTWQILALGEAKGLAVMDMKLLTGAIDRQLGGQGTVGEDPDRPPTLVEEAVGRKLFEKALPGLTDAWRGFLPELPPLAVVASLDGSLRSPWEPTSRVIETAFFGGWSGCEGIVRFLWPFELTQQAFGSFDCRRVDVDDWRPQPWELAARVLPPQIHFNRTDPLPSGPPANPVAPPVPPAPAVKKRISFDDFDAMIETLK